LAVALTMRTGSVATRQMAKVARLLRKSLIGSKLSPKTRVSYEGNHVFGYSGDSTLMVAILLTKKAGTILVSFTAKV